MSLRPSARTQVRKNQYKVSVDDDEGRHIREDNLVEIRKSRREESLQKHRKDAFQQQQQQQQFPIPAVDQKVSMFYVENLISYSFFLKYHHLEMEMMKERFAKLLLGEDMSGGGKGVCTALAISNAITNLADSLHLFGDLAQGLITVELFKEGSAEVVSES